MLNRRGERLHEHSVFKISTKSTLNLPAACDSVTLWFAKGVVKVVQIGKPNLGETANYGIKLMEISNLYLEADSSCSPTTRSV